MLQDLHVYKYFIKYHSFSFNIYINNYAPVRYQPHIIYKNDVKKKVNKQKKNKEL